MKNLSYLLAALGVFVAGMGVLIMAISGSHKSPQERFMDNVYKQQMERMNEIGKNE